jgi:GAF domain-containing protein
MSLKDQDIVNRMRFPEVEEQIEALRRMVKTRDLLIADLEREIRELRATDELPATVRSLNCNQNANPAFAKTPC